MTSRLVRLAATLVVLASLAAPGFAAPGPGDVPPPAVGIDVAGDPVLLTHYAGKAVVMTFWATWCPHCIKELPVLESVQRQAGKDRLAVIAVNTESREVFRKATRYLRDKTDLELASDANGAAQAAYGVHGIPHMLIIGRDGRVVRVYRGYSEDSLDGIVADINQALAPAP